MTYHYWLPYTSDIAIGRSEGNLFIWEEPPEYVAQVMQENGPDIAVIDEDEDTWTGDEFWSLVGDLAWDTSAVPS